MTVFEISRPAGRLDKLVAMPLAAPSALVGYDKAQEPSDGDFSRPAAGQTEARIELPPGRHTLQLVLGDAKHIPFNPLIASKKITITVY